MFCQNLRIVILLAAVAWTGSGVKSWTLATTPQVAAVPTLGVSPPTILPRTCGNIPQVSKRVISGSNASHGSWPWQVTVYFNKFLICGGVLIGPLHVLSAAHCFNNIPQSYLSKLRVVLGDHTLESGEHTEQNFTITKIDKHERYSYPTQFNNDIVLVTLNKPVIFTKFVQPICLPANQEPPKVNRKCFVSGWGRDKKNSNAMSNVLQQTSLNILSHTDCQLQNNKIIPITSKMFCAGIIIPKLAPNTACHGDSGGPLVCQENNGSWTLNGLVSWGSSTCDTSDAYTVFVKVSAYIDWITLKRLQSQKKVTVVS